MPAAERQPHSDHRKSSINRKQGESGLLPDLCPGLSSGSGATGGDSPLTLADDTLLVKEAQLFPAMQINQSIKTQEGTDRSAGEVRSPWPPSTHPTPWKKQSRSGRPAGHPQLTCSGHGSSGAPWCPTIFPASLEGPLEGWEAGDQAETAASPSEGPGSVEPVGPPQSGRASTIILQAACHQESRGQGGPHSLLRGGHPSPQPHPGPARCPCGLATSWLPSPQKTAAHSM